jgi:hypothetical protein
MPMAAQWLDYPTPGIPRLPDGSPDLSGIWAAKCGIYNGDRCFVQSYYFDLAKDLPEDSVQMTPWAEGIARQRVSRNHIDDPDGYSTGTWEGRHLRRRFPWLPRRRLD